MNTSVVSIPDEAPEEISFSTKLAVFVAALGYFVDVFDIALFSILRVPSLTDLGLPKEEILPTGIHLLNMQLVGMFIGGALWGVLGDKIGRVQVLFGSIFLYSVGNIANSFVNTVDMYALCRLISGVGLAGEVGAGVTLVAELMPKRIRGLGTAFIAAVGTFGAVVASVVAQIVTWRTAYLIGGLLGLVLLVLRVKVVESGMFSNIKSNVTIRRGELKLLLFSKERLAKYVACILAGTPLFFTFYVLITLCPEVGLALGIAEPLVTAKATLYFTIGMTIGDIFCGLLSQYLKSRKRALALFVTSGLFLSGVLLSLHGASATLFYVLCFPAGLSMGYWATFITTAAEQFGTNVRATVATTAPNFVRATPIFLNMLFLAFKDSLGVIASLQIVGILAYGTSLIAIYLMRETFHQDLDFVETSDGRQSTVEDLVYSEKKRVVGWS